MMSFDEFIRQHPELKDEDRETQLMHYQQYLESIPDTIAEA